MAHIQYLFKQWILIGLRKVGHNLLWERFLKKCSEKLRKEVTLMIDAIEVLSKQIQCYFVTVNHWI